jgi:hypothetical protein
MLGVEARDLRVEIDVKPGCDPAIINLRSFGVVPVAVLSTETFDATQVPPETVEFAGAPVAACGWGNYRKRMARARDVDGDGLDDMVFHFRTRNLQLEDGVKKATLELTGQFIGKSDFMAKSASITKGDPIPISGTEDVYILRPRKSWAFTMKSSRAQGQKYLKLASTHWSRRGKKRSTED